MNASAAHAHRVDHRHAAGGDIVAVAHPAASTASRSPGQGRRRPAGPRRTAPRAPGVIGLGGRAKWPWTSIATSCAAATAATDAVDQRLRARLVVEASRGRILTRSTARSGTTLLGPPPSILRRIDRQAGAHPRLQPQREVGGGDAARCARPAGCARRGPTCRVTVKLKLPLPGRAPGEGPVGQRRGLVGQRGALAPRRRARSAPAEPSEPTSSSELMHHFIADARAPAGSPRPPSSAASMTAIPPFMSATPGPFSTVPARASASPGTA